MRPAPHRRAKPPAALAATAALAAALAIIAAPLGAQQETEDAEADDEYIEEVIAVCARWDDRAGQWSVYTPETDPDSGPECVTVERRGQALQDLGVTAYSFDGEGMKMQGVQNLTDLSDLAPGLEIGQKQGNVEVWIRGVGSSNNTELGDPAAAPHMDGVYVPRPSGIGSAFFDIARVEVNVGPQGTLRGRNAICFIQSQDVRPIRYLSEFSIFLDPANDWPANDWHVGAYSSIKSCVHEPCHCSCGHPTRTVSYTRTHSLLGSACCCLCLQLVLCEEAISHLQDQSILLRSMSGSITTLYNLTGFH